MAQKESGISYDTKTLIVVLTLIFVYPVGLLLMFLWMKWRWWIKLLIALPVTFIVLILAGAFAVGFLATVNPGASFQKGQCVAKCNEITIQEERGQCIALCDTAAGTNSLNSTEQVEQ